MIESAHWADLMKIHRINLVMKAYNHIGHIYIYNLMLEALILSRGWFLESLAFTLVTCLHGSVSYGCVQCEY